MEDKPTRRQMVEDLRFARSQTVYYKGACERLTDQMQRMEESLGRSLSNERVQNTRLRTEMEQMRFEMEQMRTENANLRREAGELRAENRSLCEFIQEMQARRNVGDVQVAGAVVQNPILGSPASSHHSSIPSECNCPNCAPHLYTPSNASTDTGVNSPGSPTVCPVCCYHVRRR